jgi:hypothetical protein
MTLEDKLERELEELGSTIRPNEKLINAVMSRIEEQGLAKQQGQVLLIRRIIMNRFAKLAAAAAIITVAAVVWSIFPTSVIPAAYALQDTIEAYNSIRFLHIRETESIFQLMRTSEAWLQCDKYGNVTRMRFQADWVNAIGPLTVVGGLDGTQAWLKRFNLVLQGRGDTSVILGYDVLQIEPKALFERLYQQEQAGEIILDINEPQEKREPIKVTVTYPQGSRSENWKKVLYVDQATKLVTKIEKFQFGGGQYNHVKTSEFSDYNQQIDPMMFNLTGEVPEDAKVVEMTDSETSLPQGDMTDEEFAREITRQFFEAVISKDFYKAGQLSLAAPGSMIEQSLSGANLLEILSIGPAYPDPDPDSNAMICSCKALLEFNGSYYELDAWRIRIVRVEKDPNLWLICDTDFLVIPAPGKITITHDNIGLDSVTYNSLKPGEFMKKWLVLGPLPYPTLGDIDFSSKEGQRIAFHTDNLDFVNFAPKVNIDGTEYEWAMLESEHGIIGLEELSEGSNNYTIDYVWAQIDMPEETKGTLGIGSDDGVKVWLNGELIHKNWMYRTVGVDNDRVPVLFKKGRNQLVLKIQNSLGYSGFCCRLLGE